MNERLERDPFLCLGCYLPDQMQYSCIERIFCCLVPKSSPLGFFDSATHIAKLNSLGPDRSSSCPRSEAVPTSSLPAADQELGASRRSQSCLLERQNDIVWKVMMTTRRAFLRPRLLGRESARMIKFRAMNSIHPARVAAPFRRLKFWIEDEEPVSGVEREKIQCQRHRPVVELERKEVVTVSEGEKL